MDEHKKKSTQDPDRTTETTTFQIESLLADVKHGIPFKKAQKNRPMQSLRVGFR